MSLPLTRWLAAAFAALLLFTGCSDRAGGDRTDSSAAATPTDTVAADLADGMQSVRAEVSGVRFDVPEDWQVMGPEALDNPGSRAELADLAERSDIPLEQWQQMVAQVDVLAIRPDGTENVNVLPLRGVGSAPAPDLLRSDLERVGATVTGVEETDTFLGPGRVAQYTIPTQRGEQHGASLFVVADGTVVNVTGTTGSAERAIELTEQIAATLAPLG